MSLILSKERYKTLLASGSVPEAEPHIANTTTHYCFGPMLGMKAGVVEKIYPETTAKGLLTGIIRLKLLYTYGHNIGAISYGTIANNCPVIQLVCPCLKLYCMRYMTHIQGPSV